MSVGNGHGGQHNNLYPGHFCPTCGNVVRPGAQAEAATIAPEIGRSGNPILLSSYNNYLAAANPENPSRIGYCFNCKEWVTTKRLSVLELRYMYATRAGVSFRFTDGSVRAGDEKKARAIVNLIAARLEGAGSLVREGKRKR